MSDMRLIDADKLKRILYNLADSTASRCRKGMYR